VSKGRFYVEGQSRALDDLAKTYEKLEGSGGLGHAPRRARRAQRKGPLGLGAKKKPSADPFSEGKEAAVRITKFIALCASRCSLHPSRRFSPWSCRR
jgi:hypothetical protein